MSKKKVAIVGYGNIGRYALEAVLETPDMELTGIVRRSASLSEGPPELAGFQVVSDIKDLRGTEVALLCGPTRSIPETAINITSMGIHTVDSFDIHGEALWQLRQQLDASGKKHNTVSILSAGWDPGSDSVVRTLMQAMAPKGITYTNFGPGMSMGHTVAVKSKEGVKNALSMTIPTGTGIHRRLVYVELKEGADFGKVEKAIQTDAYFAKDETIVTAVPCVDALLDMGHGVLMERKGVSGKTQNQLFEFRMKINNPALTAQIMVASARASFRQQPGAYTLPEIPVMDLLPGDRETLIKTMV